MAGTGVDLSTGIAGYFARTLAEHGPTARGVDWNGEAGQTLRFAQLCKIIAAGSRDFSLNDLGCGYGALLDFVADKFAVTAYCGVDVCSDMVAAARARHAGHPAARFITATEPDAAADYGMASGIFNVRLAVPDDIWLSHVQATLDTLHATSRAGFAFNCLTTYSDPEKMRASLYYADPCRLFDLCKRRYSKQVALLHDYGLYEFTVLVRKT
ncbi:MAG TPA: class I SAM-dependent methyltransferase [Candidatus Acidoferrum sp.]|nr:class I SAM-dependent methyltransferase [Candidatus Acidoferrum sp.]